MRSRVTLAVAAVIGISAVLTPITLVVGPALRAAALSDAQEITTIAGGAVPGYSGDGGPATSAKLSGPSSVGVDGSGNIADFDYANHRVRLTAGSTGRYFNQSMTAGDIYTVAGNGTLGYSGDGGPATSAELSFGSVSVDFSGNLIISDSSNNRVRVVAASTGMFYGQSMVVGDIYTTAGNGSSGYSGDGGSALSAKMTSPEETTIDGWGNLAINDAGNGVVRLLAVASGTFYGHSMTAGDIYTVAGNGYGGYSGDGGPALSAEFFSISDVVSDLSGNLLIADAGNGRVRAVAATTGTFYGQSMTAGYVYSIAGNGDSGYAGDGGPATSAVFSVWSPGALAVDRSGNVIISDSSNNRVRAVAASTGTFYGQSMTVGYIYTVAGDGISGLSGDGGPATSASVSPGGVTVDGSGNLIIGGGSEVRVVWSGLTPVGTITGVSPLTALARATSVGSGRAAVHDPSCTHGAYPVNCASGDFWHSFVDASVAGRGPGLGLNRTYNSLNAATTGMFGYGWTSSYGISLVVNGDSSITIIEADGSQVTATPNGGGGFTLPSWADSSLSLSSGNYTFVQHQTQTYVFDSSGQLTSISNPNNYATTLSYTSGKLTTVTDSASRTLTIAYGINGLVSTVTDPLSRVTTYGYDGSGNLTSVTDPASRVTSFTYDSNHLLLTMTLPNGQSGGPDAGDKVTNTYDGQGRVLTQVDPAGLETTYSYVGDNFSSTGGSTTITDPHGNIEVEDYINGTLVSLTKGYGTSVAATTTYAYDSSTLGQSSVTDPNGHTTTNTYDLSGNELTSTDALGKTTVYTYNSLNEPLTVTDPMGIETTYTYDSGGNVLTKVVTGDGGSPPTQTTSYTYGDGHPGDLTEVTDPDGHVTTYSYDSHGDRTSSSVFVTGAQTSATSSVDRFSYGSISAVGSLASSGGVGDTTLSVSPATVGDAFVASVRTASSSITVSSISGGGATWSKLQGATDSKQGRDVELWLGVISATGSSTITVTYSSSVSGTSTEILAQEYTNGTGSGTTWTKDTASSSDNSTSSTTVTFPSLTPAGSNELYVGFAGLAHTGSAGSTSGFTYDISPTYTNPYIYNTNVSSNVSPTATQSPKGQSLAVGVLLIASGASYGSISAVGSLASSGGVGDTTLSVSPATVGDAFVASVRTASSSITVSSISGGGATWSKLQGATDSTQGKDVELWLGVISATGSSTITVTYSSSVSGTSTEILAQEYTNGTGSGTTWTKNTASSSDNSTSSTTVTFPSLTPAGSNELYVGFAGLAHTGSAGSTSGFTYDISPTYTNPYIYNTNVSSNVSPTATQSPTGQSLAVGVLLIAKAAPSTVATVSGLSSSTGPVSGGTFVVITGSNLSMTTAVHFGSTSVGFGVIGATSVFVFTPSGTTGTVDVTVTTAGTANTTNTVYDSDGELLCTSSPTASNSGVTCPAPGGGRVADTTTNVYNADGQVTSATDPNGNATTTTYDADGNTTQVTDALSNVTKTTYDADDRTTAVTNGYGSGSATTTSSTFDIAPGSCPSAPTGTTYCSQSTDGLSNVTTSYFNALDQMIEQAPPNTTAQSVATYAYDGVGNVLTKTDGSGTVTYTVDVDNRPSTVTYSATPSGMAQPHAVTYSYDYDGNRTQMTDGTGTTTYGYDPFERLNEVTNGASQVITYGYDADSNVTCLSYPNSGSTTCLNASSGTGLVAYTYNEASQATQLSDWLGNSTTFTYDADGNLVNTTMPSGTTTSTSNTYDNANGLTDTSVQTGSTVTDMSRLTRNADDNIASTTPASGGGTAYGYDSLNRVTAGTTAGYTYNADSQVASTTPTGGSATNFSYNADSQLCWTGSTSAACGSPPSGATAYSYNTAGERASSTPSGGTPTTDGWDQAGNLTCETAPNSSSYSCASPNAGSTTTFAYNGDGLRMSEVPAGGSTQQFAWDVGSSTPNLLQDGTNYYLYGPNVASAPIEQITVSGSTPTWLISDTTGVRQQISSTGSTIGSMSYNSFGNRCGGCSISTPFGFAGAYSDPTGLVYLIHRYYDPTTGQFLSVDPLVDQSGQPYAYTSNDPVNLRDPSGLCNSNPFSGSFWTGGNCIAGAVGGPTGSPGESLTGVVKSIGLLAAGDVVIVGGGYIAGVGGVAFASSVEGGTAAVAADTSFWGLTWASDVGVTGLTFASSLLIPPGLAFAGLVWLGGAISAGSERQRTCSKS